AKAPVAATAPASRAGCGAAMRATAVCMRGHAAHHRATRPQRNVGGALLRGGVPLGDLVPVDHVPPRLQVVRALVLVLEVVGVLPDVDAEQRGLARADRRVLGGSARDLEPAPRAVVDEPGPAAAELADAGRV